MGTRVRGSFGEEKKRAAEGEGGIAGAGSKGTEGKTLMG